MKALYFDCFSGISGDMTVAALNSLGVPADYITEELEKLNIKGLSVEFGTTVKNGISAGVFDVIIQDGVDHPHRNHKDIIEIIDKSGIRDNAKKISKEIFKTIAEAEAKVHGVSAEDVHFHEVGAFDSIADIVGAAVCIDYLNPDIILSSIVNDGFGFSFCSHGRIPVPVPAVVEIFADKNVCINQIQVEGELVTPTGAGIIATLAKSFAPINNLKIHKTGWGAGKKDFGVPNVLRVYLCETCDAKERTSLETVFENNPENPPKVESVTVIEANIDDQTPESLGFVMEKLLAEGAADVFFTPIQMKKNRPASLLTVICNNEALEKMCGLIFLNTTTFGIRYKRYERVCLHREMKKAPTPYGDVHIKIGYWGNGRRIAPEYESAKSLALKNNVPIDEIYKYVYKYELI